MHRGLQRGIALVLVLWVIVLLGVIAGAMSMTQRAGVTMVTNVRLDRQARALTDAGVHFMMLQLNNRNRPVEENPWPVDGRLHPWSFGGTTVWIGAITENARFDLNQVDGEVLLRLLQSSGLDKEAAVEVRDAILDWRDADNVRRPSGAEDSEYLQEGRALGARDGRFLSMDELLQVKGVTRQLLQKLAAVLTVDSRQRTVNPAFASRAVLSAIPGMTPDLVDQYLLDRRNALDQGLPPPPPPVAAGKYMGTSSANGNIFRIIAETDTSSGVIVRVETVVNIREPTPRGYRILHREFGTGGDRPRVLVPEDED